MFRYRFITTRLPVITSCSPCFLAVKPIMMKPARTTSAEAILPKYLTVALGERQSAPLDIGDYHTQECLAYRALFGGALHQRPV